MVQGLNSLGSSNPLQLNATLASSGDVIDCIATATDTMGDMDTVTVSHTVTNTAPVINSVTVTPNPATVGQDDLTCSVSGSDADGDALFYTYEWSDSTGVQQTTTLVSDTTDVFLTSGLTEDTWTCEVTPYDGTDYGASQIGSTLVESADCLGTGLVLGLDFNGGVAVDSGSIGHSVTAENSGPTLDRYSMINEAWNFQSDVNSRLVVAPSSDLVFTDSFSSLCLYDSRTLEFSCGVLDLEVPTSIDSWVPSLRRPKRFSLWARDVSTGFLDWKYRSQCHQDIVVLRYL